MTAPTKICAVPPGGWICTRPSGHDRPCAAIRLGSTTDLLAAMLKVTPLLDGDMLVGTTHYVTEYAPGEDRDPFVPDEYDGPEFGEPEPVIAGLVVTLLRWLADHPRNTLTDGFSDRSCWTAFDMEELADEIEAAFRAA